MPERSSIYSTMPGIDTSNPCRRSFLTDEQGTILYCNKALETMTGKSRTDCGTEVLYINERTLHLST